MLQNNKNFRNLKSYEKNPGKFKILFITFKNIFKIDTKSSTSSESSHYYNYNDVYCSPSNISTATNQFLNYPQNYNHEQLMHHQYFDENLHHYISYNPNVETYPTTELPCSYQQHQPENFPSVQPANELYEFLPEEIFQLDQPIIKNETSTSIVTQQFIPQQNPIIDSNPTTSTYTAVTNGLDIHPNQSFLDLNSGEIQNNAKFTGSNFSEINNNSNFNNSPTIQMQNSQLKNDTYNCHHQEAFRVNCAVENAKMKLKQYEIDQIIKHNPSSFYQNYSNIQQYAKRDGNLYATPSYYGAPEIYANPLNRSDIINN